jgi:hypothetical protein
MSRQAKYNTDIKIPKRQIPRPNPVTGELNIPRDSVCFEILQRALEKVARDHGGTVAYGPRAYYSDCTGKRNKSLISIRTGDFPRGIGINIAPNGRLSFVYDATPENELIGKLVSRPEVARRICEEIARNYAVIAVMRAQAKLGFRVSVQEAQTPQGQGVVVTGVRM